MDKRLSSAHSAKCRHAYLRFLLLTHVVTLRYALLCAAAVKLNGNRTVTGVLRGFDQFMNLVLDETVEQVLSRESSPFLPGSPRMLR